MEYRHEPVMLREVLEHLDPRPGQFFIDCTLGGAGYTLALAERVGPEGLVLAIDLDEWAIKNAKERIEGKRLKNIILENDNFRNLAKIYRRHFEDKPALKLAGVVFDLGLSGAQLEDRTRGFSFKQDHPLNMAFGRQAGGPSTGEILNDWEEKDLEGIIREYGEERFSKRIAKEIVIYRRTEAIESTGQLTEIIRRAIPARFRHGAIDPATRTFQALRIATNQELENIEAALPQALELLDKGGRIAAVSFHSLEDRLIKNFYKEEGRDCVCPPEFPVCRCDHRARLKIVTAKALKPTAEEIGRNPRSRSAKLRVAEKI